MVMKKQNRVIHFGGLMKCVFEKWLALLLVAILFAALGFGYKYIQLRNLAASSAASEQTQETDTAQAGEFSQDEYSNVIDSTVDSKNNYLANSVIGQIDPYNEGWASALISISTEEMQTADTAAETTVTDSSSTSTYSSDTNTSDGESQVSVSAVLRADKILESYLNFVDNSLDYDALAELMGTEPEYVKELIYTTDENSTTADFTVIVIYPDEEGAAKLLDAVLQQIQDRQSEVEAMYGTFDLTIDNVSSAVVVDSTLFTWKTERLQEIINLWNAWANYETKASQYASGTSSSASSAQLTSTDWSVGLTKYTAAGFVGGFLLAIICYAIVLAASGKVLSAREFNEQYDLRKLGVIVPENYNRRRGLNRKISRWGSSYNSGNTDKVCMRYAGENIRALMKDGETVAFVGDVRPETLQPLMEDLEEMRAAKGLTFEVITDLLTDPSSIDRMQDADSVVLVGKVKQTRYSNTYGILQIIDLYHKEIAGSIVFL